MIERPILMSEKVKEMPKDKQQKIVECYRKLLSVLPGVQFEICLCAIGLIQEATEDLYYNRTGISLRKDQKLE
jgi:hypothetical protein